MKNRPFIVLLAIGLVAGCTARERLMVAPVVGGEPVEIVRSVLQREASIHTLRARFHSVANIAGEERHANGALVVSKPDRFRFRLFTPFGLTVFDYLQRDGQSWVHQPLRAPDKTSDEGDSSRLFSENGMGAAFLNRYDFDPAQCRIETDVAECGDPPIRIVRIDLRRGFIVEEVSPDIVIRYGDQRMVDGLPLPYDIAISDQAHGLSVHVSIDAYEVNVPLGDDLFAPPAPSLALPRSQKMLTGEGTHSRTVGIRVLSPVNTSVNGGESERGHRG